MKKYCIPITDEIYFASRAFRKRLQNICTAALGKYIHPLNVVTENCGKQAFVAYTDYHSIHINISSEMVPENAERKDKTEILIGLLAHEIGHVLYTDFEETRQFQKMIADGTLETEHMQDEYLAGVRVGSDPRWGDLTSMVAHAVSKGRSASVAEIFCHAANIMEDGWEEKHVRHDFRGSFTDGLNRTTAVLNSSIEKQFLEPPSDNRDDLQNVQDLILYYTRTGDLPDTLPVYNAAVGRVRRLLPYVDDAAAYSADGRKRSLAAVLLIAEFSNEIEKMLDSSQKVRSPQNRQTAKDPWRRGHSVIPQPEQSSGNGNCPGHRENTSADASQPITGRNDNVQGSQDPCPESPSNGVPPPDDPESKVPDGQRADTEDRQRSSCGKQACSTAEDSGTGSSPEDSSCSNAVFSVSETELQRDVEEEVRDNMLMADADRLLGKAIRKVLDQHLYEETCIQSPLDEDGHEPDQDAVRMGKRLSVRTAQILMSSALATETAGYIGRTAKYYTRDDKKVMSRRNLPVRSIDLAVAVLVDESGSMGDKMDRVRAAATMLYSFCHELHIPIGIYGHTEEGCSCTELRMYTDLLGYTRDDIAKIQTMDGRSRNHDGMALRVIRERLLMDDADQKMLFVISDGLPTGCDYLSRDDTFQQDDLTGIARENARLGIMQVICALGDQSERDHITELYHARNVLDMSDMGQIAGRFIRIIKSVTEN